MRRFAGLPLFDPMRAHATTNRFACLNDPDIVAKQL
jgi:hypothetical protein